MNTANKFRRTDRLTLISLSVLTLALLLFFKYFFSSTIILHTQAPNYGDIHIEVLDDSTVIERRRILIKPDRRIYLQTIDQIPEKGQIRFYFDRRHPAFITKGVLFVGRNFKLDWFGPKELIDNESHNQVQKFKQIRFSGVFEGFGDAAYFKINLKKDFSNLLTPEIPLIIVISLVFAIFIFALGLLIIKALNKYESLDRHKLKFLVATFLAILFLTSNPVKSLLAISLIFWTGYYLLRYKATDIRKPEGLIAGVFLAILVTGFSTQAELIKILKNEVQTSEDPIKFDFFQNLGNRFAQYLHFKKEIGHLNSQLKVDVYKRSPTTKVIVGKQGTMFEGTGERRVEGDNIDIFDNISDYLGRLPFEQGELDQWNTVINQRNCWLKHKGIEYLFAIAPTKALVYPELLPDVISNLKANENETRIKLLDKRLRENENLAYINLTEPLLDAKTHHTDLRLFYRTDFHWNYLGAYYAYQAIMDKMAASSTDLGFTAIPLSQFDLDVNPNWAHARFLALLGFITTMV